MPLDEFLVWTSSTEMEFSQSETDQGKIYLRKLQNYDLFVNINGSSYDTIVIHFMNGPDFRIYMQGNVISNNVRPVILYDKSRITKEQAKILLNKVALSRETLRSRFTQLNSIFKSYYDYYKQEFLSNHDLNRETLNKNGYDNTNVDQFINTYDVERAALLLKKRQQLLTRLFGIDKSLAKMGLDPVRFNNTTSNTPILNANFRIMYPEKLQIPVNNLYTIPKAFWDELSTQSRVGNLTTALNNLNESDLQNEDLI